MKDIPLSPVKNRLVEGAVQVQQAPFDTEKGYAPHAMVQAALPYRETKKLKESQVWEIKNGNFGLVIQPGWDLKNSCSVGYPTGTIPRLLLFWMTTEAKLKKSRRLELGGSLNEFVRRLGLNTNNGGGKRSDKKRLKEQMRRLFRARISFQVFDADGDLGIERWMDMQIAPEGQILWSEMYPDNPSLFENWIELGDRFYEAIMESAVPVDMRILHHIQHSPMALDLYTWLTYKAYSTWKSGKIAHVPWPSLKQQLGSSYNRLRDFRENARQHIQEINQLYPCLNLDEENNCLVIRPSRPSVLPAPPLRLAK
jgi:hypothetical protein